MKISRYVVLGACAVLLSGCASSAAAAVAVTPRPSATASASPAKATAVDPCSLVSQSEASTAAAKKLVNVVTLGAPRIPGLCAYGMQRTSVVVIVYTQVYANAAIAGAVTVDQFQSALSSLLGQASTEAKILTGIGDRAYEFRPTIGSAKGYAIVVFKGRVVFLVAIASGNAGTVEGLARTAAGRLPA